VSYVLKRMRTFDRPDILRCAEREVYFGLLLKHITHFPRFVTHFVTVTDYWLVYRDEGISLQQVRVNSKWFKISCHATVVVRHDSG
jgi:hypothetical protein